MSDEVLDELSSWSSRDRMGMFKRWHEGALSLVHLNVLTMLEVEGPLSMSRLADALDVSVASGTGIVDRMERRGLVERSHDADDRRLVLVHLTDRGAAVFRALEVERRLRLSRILAELSDEELTGFLAGIRAIHAARQHLLEQPDTSAEVAGVAAGSSRSTGEAGEATPAASGAPRTGTATTASGPDTLPAAHSNSTPADGRAAGRPSPDAAAAASMDVSSR